MSHPCTLAVPSISSLRASALHNNSIFIQWELEYDGGHPITLLEVHVALNQPRPPQSAMPTRDLVYHVMNPSVSGLVTREVETGHTYTATATAMNAPSMVQMDEGGWSIQEAGYLLVASLPIIFFIVFVGHTDIVTCGFEVTRAENCIWTLGEGFIVRGSSATPPQPSADASSNRDGL